MRAELEVDDAAAGCHLNFRSWRALRDVPSSEPANPVGVSARHRLSASPGVSQAVDCEQSPSVTPERTPVPARRNDAFSDVLCQ
jgi:hypothetical protein